jgi:hypothetical protein
MVLKISWQSIKEWQIVLIGEVDGAAKATVGSALPADCQKIDGAAIAEKVAPSGAKHDPPASPR